MNSLPGTIRNGQIVLDCPADLHEGMRVEIFPIEASQPSLGMREDEWPTTSEGIAALLARMDSLEPAWLAPADDATWRAALNERKEIEKVQFLENSDKLRSMWE